ncbi:hypothetical protein EHF33_08210 [Deinococcus psychrotolerans]|uniref:Uncharacterized protein n=1 Tax=Deinococcus psychrotolerans TaxID=2489213 RepID=A0A3G8YEY6_9DEIO|nr:permease prefix domain 1-containing protein [Deinococcus psychrotolerans]AZI42737.1 hypothetical protein EHF33_08210 [Deinococcus psychrotolerans]
MNEVERYLKRVTRGLARRQRIEVRAELESHIVERMQALQTQGLEPGDFAARVLSELGSPDEANQALRRVHYVHPALNVVVAVGVLAVTWMGWQLRMISAFPITDTPSSFADPRYPLRIVSSGDSGDQIKSLLSFSEVAGIFKGTPIKIVGNDERAQLVFSNHVSLDLGSAVRRKVEGMELPKKYGFYVTPPAFVDFNEMTLLILKSAWPISMDMSNTAVKISVDGQAFNMPSELAGMNTFPFLELWNQQIAELLSRPVQGSGFIDWDPLLSTKGKHIPLIVHDLIPKQIYALAIKRMNINDSTMPKGKYVSSMMTHADASGTSNFFNLNFSGKTLIKSFHFADSVKAWQKAPANTAILLKLDPTLKSPPEVIPRTGILTAK